MLLAAAAACLLDAEERTAGWRCVDGERDRWAKGVGGEEWAKRQGGGVGLIPDWLEDRRGMKGRGGVWDRRQRRRRRNDDNNRGSGTVMGGEM